MKEAFHVIFKKKLSKAAVRLDNCSKNRKKGRVTSCNRKKGRVIAF